MSIRVRCPFRMQVSDFHIYSRPANGWLEQELVRDKDCDMRPESTFHFSWLYEEGMDQAVTY